MELITVAGAAEVIVQSNAIEEFVDGFPVRSGPVRSGRLNLDPEKVKNGLAQLVLTLVKLLHELLERQAIRRMEGGNLSDEQIERLGITLMRQADQIEILRETFGLSKDDLNLDLGPLVRLV
jgi:hypothetical protein